MYSPPIIPTENSLSSKVDLFISCRKLKNMDVFSKSDPVCRVYEWTEKNKQWTRIGATERLTNNLNPDFKTTIQALYFFERNQKFKFEVVDDDGSGSSDPIGSVETTMGNIMGSRAQTYVTDLIGHGKSHSLG